MTKHINLQKNYTEFSGGYQLKLPLNIETIIPENDSVRLLSQFVEEMDLTDLYSTYKRINSLSPRTLLKIVLYSYMNDDYSSRSMELNCKRDINFMFLLEGHSAPDHATLARFRSIHFAPCSKRILAEVSNLLFDLGEISGETIFIDGTKIEANANKYTFVWKKAVTKNQAKLLIKLADFVAECEQLYDIKIVYGDTVKIKHLKKLRKKLYALKEVVVPLNFSKSRFGRLEVKMRIKNILGYKKASKIAGLAAVVMVVGLTVFCTSNAKETESAAKQEVTTEEASTQVANPEEELEMLGAEDDCLHANVGEDSLKFVTAYISDDNQGYRVLLKNVENDMANWSEEEKESYRKDIAEIQEREGAPLYICSSCAKKGFVKSEMTQEELEESLKDREPIIEEYAKKLEAEGLFIDNGNLHAYYQNNQYSFNGIMAADTNDGNCTFMKYVFYVNKEGWDIVQNTFDLGDLEKTDYGYKSTFVDEIGQRIEYEYHEADNVLISTIYFNGKEKE